VQRALCERPSTEIMNKIDKLSNRQPPRQKVGDITELSAVELWHITLFQLVALHLKFYHIIVQKF